MPPLSPVRLRETAEEYPNLIREWESAPEARTLDSAQQLIIAGIAHLSTRRSVMSSITYYNLCNGVQRGLGDVKGSDGREVGFTAMNKVRDFVDDNPSLWRPYYGRVEMFGPSAAERSAP